MKGRRPSNQLKQKQLQTKNLEEQTRKMEDKLSQLKRQIEQQKRMKSEMNLESTVTRWQKATKAPQGPLKSYAKQVLEEQKQAHAKFGINTKTISGTKTFEGVLKKIKSEKEQQQERNPTKITTFLIEPSKVEQPPKKIQENNFFKAKMDIKSLIKQKTLEQFLQQNFILEYLRKFNEEGITDLEGLRYVSKDKLNEMGVKAGHQVKIIKKIKEQFDKLLNGKVEEPKIEKTTSQKVSFGYGEGDINTYGQLEQKEKQEQLQQTPEEVANIELNSNILPREEQSYEDEQQDVVMITAPMHSIELQVNEQERVNCYECYKVIAWPDLHYDQKYFCSPPCMQLFMLHLKKSCPACGKTFLKTEGYHQQGLWFCSLGCCPNHEDLEEMFFQWHRNRQ